MYCYVYQHVDPRNGEVRYIGKGQDDRAWRIQRNKTYTGQKQAGRREEHWEWLQELKREGYVVGELVEILARGLSKKEALRLEREFIEKHPDQGRLFNVTQGRLKACVLGPDEFTKVVLLRSEGLSYAAIADQIGVSTMTIHRAINGQTKGYQAYERPPHSFPASDT